MKTILTTLFLSLFYLNVSAQFVARMEVKEPIEGVCDNDNVYALFGSLEGQTQASCGLDDKQMIDLLNEKIAFIRTNPKYKDKGMISLIINCEGEVVVCKMDNKTKSEELDKQLEEFFNALENWTVGKLNGKPVDSVLLFSFEIKRGKFVK